MATICDCCRDPASQPVSSFSVGLFREAPGTSVFHGVRSSVNHPLWARVDICARCVDAENLNQAVIAFDGALHGAALARSRAQEFARKEARDAGQATARGQDGAPAPPGA
jgi:predicted membrane metal-binding protein